MKKSLLSISFLLIIFAIFLTGCSSNSTTNGNKGTTTTNEQPEETKETSNKEHSC